MTEPKYGSNYRLATNVFLSVVAASYFVAVLFMMVGVFSLSLVSVVVGCIIWLNTSILLLMFLVSEMREMRRINNNSSTETDFTDSMNLAE